MLTVFYNFLLLYDINVDSFLNESVDCDIVSIDIDSCISYILPNVFTPNYDGFNDLFVPGPYNFVVRCCDNKDPRFEEINFKWLKRVELQHLAKGYGYNGLSVISQGYGHENEKTTEIYLASFDNDVIDKANELITR